MEQKGFVHFCYPAGSAWVLRLLGRLHNSESEVLKDRVGRWGESRLADLGLALASKLQIVGVSVHRVDDVVGRIGRELEGRQSEIAALMNEDACLNVRSSLGH